MKLTNNVTVLGNQHFHIYAVGKNPFVLIEGAVSAVVPTVASQLKKNTIIPSISHLIIMHAHFDHVCAIPGLRILFPKMRIAASVMTREILKRKKLVANFFLEDALMTETLGRMNLLTGTPGFFSQTIDVDDVISNGECIFINKGVKLQFHYAPGHSPCSMVAYHFEDEVIFSSDCAGFPIDNNRRLFPIFFESYQNYIKTIDRISDFNANILACAHEQIVIGKKKVCEFLNLARGEAERARENIVRLLGNGFDELSIAERLFEHYYTGNLRIYSEKNIRLCCQLLVRRVKEIKN